MSEMSDMITTRLEPLSEEELRKLDKPLGLLAGLVGNEKLTLRLVLTIRAREADLREARWLLEETTGFSDSAGLPMTESLLGRILLFLQRTESRERGTR